MLKGNRIGKVPYDEDNYPVTKKSLGKYINNGSVSTKEENTQIRYFRK